ncbi:hypothetical protein GGX14DRAFT_544369 [Mycena pura]|uniref:Uncharacterized protein n=1 Tax=Mycena pura TaxID=153505 RepID=A0AAD6V952_9AGAR|nr:hypothetical protein GGX14DRAFT_544369 [Mycena pura]
MPRRLIYALLALLLAQLSLSTTVSDNHASNTSLTTRASSPLSFAASKWIWRATYTADTFVALRKDFTPPLGKSLIAAEILVTVDNNMQLYVNGEFIGSGTPGRTRFAQRFCVDLQPSFNVFAINASSSNIPDAAMIATILLTYSDFTTDTIVSDASWRVHAAVAGFEQLSFDDTAWPAATIQGAFGDAPWNQVHIPSDPPVISFARDEWVWTDAIPANGKIPAGSRAFRRTFTPAPGQVPMSADIIVTADNTYTLWVNGVELGTGTQFSTADHYTVNFASVPSEVVFAVLATNNAAGTAGILVAAEINMVPSGRASCTAGSFVLTDVAWVSTKGAIPTGWEQPGFDDSAWPPVAVEDIYPDGPWGTVTIAAASPPVSI